MLSIEEQLMDSSAVLPVLESAWKMIMLLASPSLMGLQVHDSISGHLLLHSMKLTLTTWHSHAMFALALTPTLTGHIKFLRSLETAISVTPAIMDPATSDLLLHHTQMILCGMVRGVVLLVPAANSTTLLGSAQHCHSPLQMILS